MPKFSRAFLLLLALGGSAIAATRPQAPARVPGADQVQSTTLANGMKVIIWTDRDIPNVALYNWCASAAAMRFPASPASHISSNT